MLEIQHKAQITCDKMSQETKDVTTRSQCGNTMIITGLPAEDCVEAFKGAGWHTNPDGDINYCPVHAPKPETEKEDK